MLKVNISVVRSISSMSIEDEQEQKTNAAVSNSSITIIRKEDQHQSKKN